MEFDQESEGDKGKGGRGGFEGRENNAPISLGRISPPVSTSLIMLSLCSCDHRAPAVDAVGETFALNGIEVDSVPIKCVFVCVSALNSEGELIAGDKAGARMYL